MEGWEGKPKGVLQILWERGFIDPAKKKEDHTIDGKKDALGTVDPGTSLKRLMRLLTDFMGSSESADVDDDKKPHMTACLTEKIVKQCKSHRSAADFDAGFINKIVDKMREQQHADSGEQ